MTRRQWWAMVDLWFMLFAVSMSVWHVLAWIEGGGPYANPIPSCLFLTGMLYLPAVVTQDIIMRRRQP